MTGTEELSTAECWQLLPATGLGRIALMDDGGIDIFPVNYLANDGAVYFSSAPGSKLIELTRDSTATFEADGVVGRKRWSVVIRGHALRLGSDPEIEESGVLELTSYSPTTKWNYVKIVPSLVTGRRFAKAQRSPSM